MYVCAWFVIRTVRISLVLSCFWDKALLFLSLTHSALERREQLLGSDDARKRNHIDRSIIKTTLSTFVSFMSILYEKYTKCSAKVKWTDSSVRMACVLLYHINRTILLFLSLSSPIKKQHQWTSIWQLWVFTLYPFRFDRITCSFGISDFAVVIVASRMSSDRRACDIYIRSLVDCLRNDLTGLIYHKLSSTVIQKNRRKNYKSFRFKK